MIIHNIFGVTLEKGVILEFASKMMVVSEMFPVNMQKFYTSVSNDDFASINEVKLALQLPRGLLMI
jgi:hypothetical protein